MRVLVAALFIASLILFGTSVATRPAGPTRADATVTITGVVVNHSSVKIRYAPVPGAADYRVMDLANTGMVKYAGLEHYSAGKSCDASPTNCGAHFLLDGSGAVSYPYTIARGNGPVAKFDAPALSIELNAIEDEQPHTVIIQAVNQLGPVPPANLYDNNNTPIPGGMGTPHPGGNMGMTADGLVSINGQGPDTNQPQVIAQSASFVVQANPALSPIPSGGSSTQDYIDQFADPEQQTLSLDSSGHDNATYQLNQGTARAAHISLLAADTAHSGPFIMQGHFMDVLFDGGTPGGPNPLHTRYGALSFLPDQAEDFTGKVLHLTMEVDGHFNDRRWMDLTLTPPNDPFTSFVPGDNFSQSDLSLTLALHETGCTLQITTGKSPTTNQPKVVRLWGAAGQAPVGCDPWNGATMNGGDLGFDNRVRFDLFVSQTHAALFIDGRFVQQGDITGGVPFSVAQAGFVHLVYHTALAEQEILSGQCNPMNAFWFVDPINGTHAGTGTGQSHCGVAYPPGMGFRHSDEKHWSSIGAEVLPIPSNPDWSQAFTRIVQPQ